MPRRFHRKSRFGCLESRKGRVKCDEAQPICGRCDRNHYQCHYADHEADGDNTVAVSQRSATPSSTVAQDQAATPVPPSFDVVDMMLMHHYATNTSQHIFAGERQHQVWQLHVPSLASSNIVLVHGFLALTAIHKAILEPAQRELYRHRAIHHHGLGLTLFQELFATASSDRADVIVIWSILNSIWVYAFPEIADEAMSFDSMLNTIEVARGSRKVFLLYREAIMKSPISPLMDPNPSTPLRVAQAVPARQALQALWSEVQHPADRKAVECMKALLEDCVTGVSQNRAAAHWMAMVEDNYWLRLRQRQPDSLLVFVYSTLLVRASEQDCWWMAGWSERIWQVCGTVLNDEAENLMSWSDHMSLIRTTAEHLAHAVRSRDERG